MSTSTDVALDQLILIVDDDQDIRESLRDMLQHEGYCVHLAETGADAIREVTAAHYGAVILDIGLPDLDGHAVLRAVSQADPQLPVIILTANGTEQNTIGPLTRGAFAYMVKPYSSAQVKAVIRRACDVRALSVKAEHVEHALSESEERFRSVVHSTSDAVVIAEGSGRIVFWNTSAQRMFLYTDEEVLGRPLTMIMPIRYREAQQLPTVRQVRSWSAQAYRVCVLIYASPEWAHPMKLERAQQVIAAGPTGIIRDGSFRVRLIPTGSGGNFSGRTSR